MSDKEGQLSNSLLEETDENNQNVNVTTEAPVIFIDKREYHTHETNITGCNRPQIAGGDVISHSSSKTYPQSNEVKIAKQNAAINKVWEIQQRYQEEDYFLQTSKPNDTEIPIVYPKMVEAFIYQSSTPKKVDYCPSTEPNYEGDLDAAKEITFENLLSIFKQSNFISLIGWPGSGKSCLSKRIAKFSEMCFLIKFENLNFDAEYKLTLQELILNHNYLELKNEECEAAFDWILSNEEKCLFIMDGYDQVTWNMKEQPPVLSYSEPQPVWNIVSNLCSKKYLGRSHILFTSRPHSLRFVPKTVRPDMTILLLDLTFENMKSLFFAFSGTSGQQFWDNIHATAPQLVNVCLNPLLLQLVVKACLKFMSSIGEITNMTQVFTLLLDDLRVSHFTRHEDIQTIRDQLSSLAFKAIENSTVMMNVKDLKDLNLDIDTVQDLVISQHTFRNDTCKVFDGESCLYFSQPTFQEYFAAYHVCNNMPFQDFKEFVQSKLFTSQWCAVRQFLMGMLRNIEENTEDFQSKRDLLTNMLVEEMMRNPKQRDLIDLCSNLRELDDIDVTNKAALHFPVMAGLWLTPVFPSDTHALSYVLKRLEKKIDCLDFGSCDMDSESFVYIIEAISEMPISIGSLIMNYNKLSSKDIKGICSILHKVDDGLGLWNAFVDDGGERRSANSEEREMIQAKLDELPSSSLWVYVDEVEFLQKQSCAS